MSPNRQTPERVAQLALLLLAMALAATASAESDPEKARLAIIIDDVGYNLALGRRAARLPGEFTLAILPMTPHSQTLAALGQAEGKELMLHTPMANRARLALGPGGLTLDMSRAELITSLRTSLDSVPAIRGLNNHTGSALTRLPAPMGWIMQEAARRDLYFIDSRTTAESRALDVARAYGLASASRDVFLDHSRDPDDIAAALQRAIDLARRRGHAIAIGHPHPQTLALLENAPTLLQKAGVTLVPASHLVRRAPRSTGACPAPPIHLRRYVAPKPTQTPPELTLRSLWPDKRPLWLSTFFGKGRILNNQWSDEGTVRSRDWL